MRVRSAEEFDIIICPRVGSVEDPVELIAGSETAHCETCGDFVWMTPWKKQAIADSQAQRLRPPRVVCARCAIGAVKAA